MEKIMYDKFKKYYFKDRDADNISNDFVDVIVDSNEVFVKYFKEGKGRLQVAQETGTHKNIVGSMMSTNIERIIVLYDIFERTNGDVNLIKSLLDVKFLDKYADDIVGLHNKGIKNPLMYARFTKCYFPKLMGKLDKVSKSYIKFVDELVSRRKILKQYFKDNKSAKEIAEETGIVEHSVMDKVYWEKHYVRRCYQHYLEVLLEKKNRQSALNNKK